MMKWWPLAWKSTVKRLERTIDSGTRCYLEKVAWGLNAESRARDAERRAQEWEAKCITAHDRIRGLSAAKDVTLEVMAEAFDHWSDDIQAHFFDTLAELSLQWPGAGRLHQFHGIGKCINDEGREFIRELARAIEIEAKNT